MLSRREAIGRAIYLVAGLSLAPAACSPPTRSGFFTAKQMKLLEELCETIIPQTETPGARATNVHGFIDGMMSTWASPATRDSMAALLKRLDEVLPQRFIDLDPKARHAAVEAFDKAAFAANDEAWGQLKKLVLLGYYTSEIGATQEAAYLPVPGEWLPDVPVTADTRTWAE